MKAGSGWDCRGVVMLRGSGLKVVQEAEEKVVEVVKELGVIKEEDEEEGEVILEEAAQGVFVGEEKEIEAAVPDAVPVVEVAEKPDLDVPPIDLALPSKHELDILPFDLAPIILPFKLSPELLPIDLAPRVESEISPIEAMDLAPLPPDMDTSTTIPLPCDMDTSSAIPTKPIQDEGYFTDASISPPLSPTLTSIGLAPAATFAKPARKHQRRDSQQTLDGDSTSSGASSVVDEDVEDIRLEYCAPVVSLEDTEDRQDAATFGSKDADLAPILAENSGTSTTGWYKALSMSWTTVALITAGVLAGGAMCVGQRRC